MHNGRIDSAGLGVVDASDVLSLMHMMSPLHSMPLSCRWLLLLVCHLV
jgi:hypothetical protein